MPVKELKINTPNPALIEELERMVKEAKKGTIQGIAGITIFDDGGVDDYWITAPKPYHISVVSDRIVGCLERLKYQLLSMRHKVDVTDDIFVG